MAKLDLNTFLKQKKMLGVSLLEGDILTVHLELHNFSKRRISMIFVWVCFVLVAGIGLYAVYS